MNSVLSRLVLRQPMLQLSRVLAAADDTKSISAEVVVSSTAQHTQDSFYEHYEYGGDCDFLQVGDDE